MEQAIELVTIDAAYALSQETTSGSIEVAKFADFVILDQNLLEIDVDEIENTAVLLTAVGGAEVYRAAEF